MRSRAETASVQWPCRRSFLLDLSGIDTGASQPIAESQKKSESSFLKTHVSSSYC
jgi:hypothetical protein